jgi:hypothetical protein
LARQAITNDDHNHFQIKIGYKIQAQSYRSKKQWREYVDGELVQNMLMFSVKYLESLIPIRHQKAPNIPRTPSPSVMQALIRQANRHSKHPARFFAFAGKSQ